MNIKKNLVSALEKECINEESKIFFKKIIKFIEERIDGNV